VAATRPAVLVLARHPDFGPVKTRLAADVGAAEARRIYAALAARVWEGLADPAWERWLWITPAAACAAAADWLPGADRVEAQPDGDLGARLAAAVAAACAEPRPWVAVVGTDAPDVDAALLRGAAVRLRPEGGEADAVVVPAEDGGYAALLLATPAPELFRDVPWGGPEVLAVTRRRATAAGLVLAETAPVRDLDTAADLAWFRARARDARH